MGIGWIIWLVLLGGVTLIWLGRHRGIARAKREQVPLHSESFDGPPADAPCVSVLVAAKDEEENIETCVRTLMDQDYPNYELIVINDRSQDRTGAILDRLAAEYAGRGDERFRPVHVTELRAGWFGKNNAMREGVEHSTGEWLCFSDADCRQTSRRTLSMAVRQALENKIDFLSVLPVLETHSFWERVIQPVCGAIMILWFHPGRVNNPRSRAAYANGAFMLMRRSAYERIGGHERVRTEVNEDMHMARLAKGRGLRLYVMQNLDLYRTRMYTGLRQIWRGWSRIFYGCFGSYGRLLISTLVLALISVMPYVSLIVAAAFVGALGWSEAGPWRWVLGFAAAAVFSNQCLIVRFYRLSQADPRYAPTYFLGSLIGLGMLINAMFKIGGTSATVWRGTTYRGNTLEAGAAPAPRPGGSGAR
jgi:chlorobactene glucosyltransferase